MTPEQAIELLETNEERRIAGRFIRYKRTVIEALEKQIPKRIETFNGQASCPNCKCLYGPISLFGVLREFDMTYCRDCGQRLAWSDPE